MTQNKLGEEDWNKVLSLHRLFKKINNFAIKDYSSATPIDLVNLIIDDDYGTLSDGLVTLYPVEDSESYYSLRMQNYSGATTYHIAGEEMPVGCGGFLHYASKLTEPEYIANITDHLTEEDARMLPWIFSMHTALIVPTMSVSGEAATTVIFAFDENAFSPNVIKHNVMLTYATTNIVLGLLLRQETTRAWNALDEELATIGRIQRAFLPKALPCLRGVEFSVHYSTSTRAGGDYYDFFSFDENKTGIFIADVAGHGSPAAIVMAMTRLLLHTFPHEVGPPEVVLTHLNRLLYGNLLPGQFITAFYTILDLDNLTLEFSNAGHCHPLVVRSRQGSIDLLKTTGGLPLGVVPEGSFNRTKYSLETGDILFFYTDGLVEATNRDKEMYGTKRLNEVLLASRKLSSDEIQDAVLTNLGEFCAEQAITDDLTFIVMKISK